MNNIFGSVSYQRPKKSAFNLTHSRKFTFAPGKVYPIMCQEVLPSDTWDYSTNALVRFQPLATPMMHLVDVYSYSYFVPARLTMRRGWFEVFITGGPKGDGKDAQGTTVSIPYVRIGPPPSDNTKIQYDAFGTGTLADYLGIGEIDPTGTDTVAISMMPFIAFWRMWCENFRDQNLHPDYVALYPQIFDNHGDITQALNEASVDPTNPFRWWEVPKVCWEKDMYTSALPFAQKGNPVETPLSGTATLTYKTPAQQVVDSDGTAISTGGAVEIIPGTGGAGFLRNQVGDPTGALSVENVEEVELTSGGFTINALRLAARLQEWLEKMARGGSRYIEQIKSHFGVTSSDARLQRPEFLSGGKIPCNISEVLQTSETETTPLGEMAGHGVAAGQVTHFRKFFEEHGFICSVIFMRPRTAYQQGLPRMFRTRFDKLDWAWPSFAHLGEQEVKMHEIFWSLDGTQNDETFGYQQRYAEYKYIPSSVHGEFRTTMAPWHWGRILTGPPTLSKEFVECDPDDRVFNVLGEGDSLYCIVSNRINCVRPLPYHGDPQL